MVHEIAATSGKLTPSHVHALNKNAVITQALHFGHDDYQRTRYKPGDIIELETDDADFRKFRCRILDIESIKTESEATISVRMTLEKE